MVATAKKCVNIVEHWYELAYTEVLYDFVHTILLTRLLITIDIAAAEQ